MTPQEQLKQIKEIILLDSDDIWNVLSFLRGPDSGNEDIKNITTGPIRYVLGISPDFLTVTSPQIALRLLQKQRDLYISSWKREQSHFQSHFRYVVTSLESLLGSTQELQDIRKIWKILEGLE